MADKTTDKNLQNEIKESANKIWLAGLGALAAAQEEGTNIFRSLVEKGESYESRGRETIDNVRGEVEDRVDRARGEANTVVDKIESRLDEAVTASLRRFGVPTREEIATLTRRVEELTTQVERLNEAKSTTKKAPAKRTAAKKPAAKSSTAKTTAES
ncbi:MAG: phasin family protein [Acidobacteriota bacterium]